jgi:hypothetical protein
MNSIALERAGLDVRAEHRSFERQGLEIEPMVKMGPADTAIERRAIAQAKGRAQDYQPVTATGQRNA